MSSAHACHMGSVRYWIHPGDNFFSKPYAARKRLKYNVTWPTSRQSTRRNDAKLRLKKAALRLCAAWGWIKVSIFSMQLSSCYVNLFCSIFLQGRAGPLHAPKITNMEKSLPVEVHDTMYSIRHLKSHQIIGIGVITPPRQKILQGLTPNTSAKVILKPV